MPAVNLRTDPLWQCLCPSWHAALVRPLSRVPFRKPAAITHRTGSILHSAQTSDSTSIPHKRQCRAYSDVSTAPLSRRTYPLGIRQRPSTPHDEARESFDPHELESSSVPRLYKRLQSYAAYGQTERCRAIVEYLVKERGEKPNLPLYNALILSNISHTQGAAWRVHHLLDEMKAENLHPDVGTCHAILKVVAVHLDHLLLTNTLHYMQERWLELSEAGAHDVMAALLREGRLEQALSRLHAMKEGRMGIEGWLLDMTVYALCNANEIEEAYRIMRDRFDKAEPNLSRMLWTQLLDKGSAARHQDATALVWNSQVNQGYINPSSGICLNVLATTSRSGDATMATQVFTHLGKRGTAFQPIHYEHLITTYLAASPPDLNRAISILTIMPLEKLQPTPLETRALHAFLRDKPTLVEQALAHLRELHTQGRQIPIAALNLLLECYIEQGNLSSAMTLYKLIHTFMPVNQTSGIRRSYANIDTFNLLLKACRTATPPDHAQASFLISELVALDITPTPLTYDRLILVFAEAGRLLLQTPDSRAQALDLLDWAYRYFTDMQPLRWFPRFGTLDLLATALARSNDVRCWDVLQYAEDNASHIEGFAQKAHWTRKNAHDALAAAVAAGDESVSAQERASDNGQARLSRDGESLAGASGA